MKLYIVDAFAERLFTGNPAAVCPLRKWLPDAVMQKIAFENNLAETAFVVKETDSYRIRWFTPTVEVDLCGHATLAAAHVLFNHLGYEANELTFNSRSGLLKVTRDGLYLTLNFPADDLKQTDLTERFSNCFSIHPIAVYRGNTDYMLIYDSQSSIENIIPYYEAIAQLDARGVIITAPGEDADFVSRFFAPQSGINEDPVTGSAHTSLAPYWAEQLNKTKLTAFQLSQRGGALICEIKGDRVYISGRAITYLTGEIETKNLYYA